MSWCGPSTGFEWVPGRKAHVIAPLDHAPVAATSDFAAIRSQSTVG
jgi:hypothetical protein